MQNMFLVGSAHLGAHSLSIVGFVYLLFNRSWSADKNTKVPSGPLLSGSGLRNSLTGWKFSAKGILYGFQNYESSCV